MVMKRASEQSEPPPYPTTPLESHDPRSDIRPGGHAPSELEQTQDGLVNLTIGEGGEIEESSDWIASDREDTDTTKMLDDRIAGSEPIAKKTLQPHLPEDQIPESLRLKKPPSPNPWTSDKSAASLQSFSEHETNLQPSLPHAKLDTNPFRRPSDFRPADAPADSTTAWSSEPKTDSAAHPISIHHSQSVANPWAADVMEHSLSTAPPPQPASNPRAEEQILGNESQPFGQRPPPLIEDPSYMADLIDLGSKEPSDDEVADHPKKKIPTAPTPQDAAPSLDHATGVSDPSLRPQALHQSQSKPATTHQRNEYYHIKHIRWHDPKSQQIPRRSPILTQNANGPCPLLALVNALSLSTPPGLQTPLLETLRSRETVSLGLLLDAVFDELMSGRRGATAQELPDVGELYSFLITLHTGMNVNPRFVPDTSSATFEQTKEMLLYGTFDISLVHGWIPSEEDPAFAAFSAIAPSYEDAQNVQFREEELEQKLGQAELTDEEQSILRDLPVIKQFLASWPTQLTQHGLQSLNQQVQPGQTAILFRNDHFSTVYREPTSGRLMTLVTDAGYSSHDEIIWESLVDINGAKSEMFSGDFRSVSHVNQRTSPNINGWTTVQKRHSKPAEAKLSSGNASAPNTVTSARTPAEQEDADLALALQLQEEEEHREREEQAARRREERLSENYLDNETARRGPQIPPRGRRNQNQTANGDELPSYEQAASERRYLPPRGHPSSEHNATASTFVQPQDQRLGMGRMPGRPAPRRGRGATPFDGGGGVNNSQAVADRREGCTMM